MNPCEECKNRIDVHLRRARARAYLIDGEIADNYPYGPNGQAAPMVPPKGWESRSRRAERWAMEQAKKRVIKRKK